MYAVMADEGRDGHVSQLAVSVHYISDDNMVKEHFLLLSSPSVFNAVSIKDAIEDVLASNALNVWLKPMTEVL